jgi:hypothetical protein
VGFEADDDFVTVDEFRGHSLIKVRDAKELLHWSSWQQSCPNQ